MNRRVTPPKRVTSPTWGPPPSCKQALKLPIASKARLVVNMRDLFYHKRSERKHTFRLFIINKKLPKIWLKSQWSTAFRVVPVENFCEQRNIWKGSPVFPDGIFQTDIRVPLVKTFLSYQFRAFASFFRLKELFSANCKRDFRDEIYQSWIFLPFAQTVNRQVCPINGKQHGQFRFPVFPLNA